MNKILLLGSQHGNELLGKHLIKHIAQSRPQLFPLVTYRTGNIRAHKQNIRYIEKDLNRSYTGKGTTYEERRAKRILSYITQSGFDLVLDLHTTTCIEPPCLIVTGITPANERFLRASSITRIVQMNHPIGLTSLIGKSPRAICVEINKDEAATSALLDALCDDIERYVAQDADAAAKTIYHVDDLLLKTEVTDEEGGALRNFERNEKGFYPILVGENSYKKQTEYLGFRADRTQTIQM